MKIVDTSLVGIWYVAYTAPLDMLCLLKQFPTHYEIQWIIREHDAQGEIENVREMTNRRKPIPLSDAIEHVRRYIKEARNDEHPVVAEWEVLRGARSDEELCELIASMPNAHARLATPEEVEMFEREAGKR